jgi:hypothetical protein
MICFAKTIFGWNNRRPIRLRSPGDTLVITGCRRERIDAVFDANDRFVRLIIYTRQGRCGPPRRF